MNLKYAVVLSLLKYSYTFIVQSNGIVTTTPQTSQPGSADFENLKNLVNYEKAFREELEHRMNTMEKLYELKFNMLERESERQVINVSLELKSVSLKLNQMELKLTELNQTEVELKRTKSLLNQTSSASIALGIKVEKQREEIEQLNITQVTGSRKLQDEINNIIAHLPSKGNEVLFRALLTRPVTYNNSVWKKVVFDTVHVNLGHAYSNSTGVFSPPYDGVYAFHAQIHTRSGQENYLSLRHGPNRIAYSYSPAHDTSWNQNSVSAGDYCKQGDSVWVESSRHIAESTGAKPTDTGGLNTYFTGYLIRAYT